MQTILFQQKPLLSTAPFLFYNYRGNDCRGNRNAATRRCSPHQRSNTAALPLFYLPSIGFVYRKLSVLRAAINLYYSVSHHCGCNFNKSRNICAHYVIAAVTVFLSRVVHIVVNINHNIFQLGVYLFESPE